MNTGDAGGGEPLYEQIKRELVAAITRGDYEADRPFVTQREVCERFQVSSTTAVRALNDLVAGGFLVRRRGAGTFVADRPDPTAAPARPHGASIACIMTGHGPHNSAVARGVGSVCAELGFRMYFTDTGGSQKLEEAALHQAVDTGAAGVVLYPTQGRRDEIVYGALRRAGVPVVMVDRFLPGIATDAVVADNFAVGYDVTDHLVNHGHRRIATLWSETDCTSVQDRLTGHVQALRRHHIQPHPTLTLLTDFDSQPEARRQAMLTDLLAMPDPPTAFLCSNGYVLATAVHDLATLRVDVPGQVELGGMDDLGPFNLLPVALVTAVLPSEEMGRKAMGLLAERVAADNPYGDVQHVVLPVELRTRESAPGYLRVVSGQAPD
ncbi:MAG TPA: GntR family transcriptional regulator [Actinopolymorphaceae bacterium]|nr:GntR family transcriptional regulator [Actinopolymorphaceae bacterium]